MVPKDRLAVLPIKKKDRNSGRYVAMEAAMMAIPTSTLDHMARSTVANRKSCDVDI